MTSCRDVCYNIFLSTIAQLAERLTVNHDVTGSNPVGGVHLIAVSENPIESINLL